MLRGSCSADGNPQAEEVGQKLHFLLGLVLISKIMRVKLANLVGLQHASYKPKQTDKCL